MSYFKFFILIIFQIAVSNIFCQISFKTTSGKEIDVRITKDLDNAIIDSVEIESNISLNTSSLGSVNRAIFSMYLMRIENSILINIDVIGFEKISEMTIERKTTNQLSNYRTIITFKPDELDMLFENNNIKFEDKYPESNKLDSYYRLKYITTDGFVRYVSSNKIEAMKSQTINFYGDQEIKNQNDFL